ncbi:MULTISPECIES: hypothetical protein [unclassified Streptomyces]|uniref:Uncharacterized protein n=1 Tax=Streptomyces sp. NBC_00119 TaxID=2975659 RepID=A0AAU1UG57_9ACTN|nr:hypothetical protein [Streptomyces sp. NBC_01446]MCX4647460.1 hypothetical protein [Streptomyces sp. NBC_01446]MCX5320026.1 hypothetical protein [Streptomyces sp. NBC_00120]
MVEQAGEQEPVTPHERQLVDLALQDRELVPRYQDLDLGDPDIRCPACI